MTVDDIITTLSLQSLLSTSQATQNHSLSIIDWLASQPSGTTTLAQQLELSRQHKILLAHIAKLRGQSRSAAFGVRDTKAETAEARQEVDRLLLQLQNLYYEQRHLLGEIGACEGYDHLYAQLPLLSVEEYLAIFPEQSSLPEIELMPNRIAYEKSEREKMEETRLELVKMKEELLKENTRKKEELKKMDERIESAIDGLVTLKGEMEGREI